MAAWSRLELDTGAHVLNCKQEVVSEPRMV